MRFSAVLSPFLHRTPVAPVFLSERAPQRSEPRPEIQPVRDEPVAPDLDQRVRMVGEW